MDEAIKHENLMVLTLHNQAGNSAATKQHLAECPVFFSTSLLSQLLISIGSTQSVYLGGYAVKM